MEAEALSNAPSQGGTESLLKLLKDTSCHELESHGKTSGVTAEELSSEVLVPDHWMAVILLAGRSLRLTFKVFYNSKTVRNFASRRLRKEPQDISPHIVADYMREFCNGTAGAAKRTLAALQVEMGLGLPIVTRAFDEVFKSRDLKSHQFIKDWKISAEDQEFVCRANIEVLDWSVLSLIEKYDPSSESEEDDDMDFL